MVVETEGEYYLAGLVASQDCEDGSMPGVYTKVSAFYDWIEPIFSGTDPTRKFFFSSPYLANKLNLKLHTLSLHLLKKIVHHRAENF